MAVTSAGVRDTGDTRARPAIRIHRSDDRNPASERVGADGVQEARRLRGIQWLEEQTGERLADPLPPPWRTVERIALRIGITDGASVTARLSFIKAVLDDLARSYDEAGQLAWWSRRHPELGGRSPFEVLPGDFDPDAQPAATIAELARALRVADA